MGKDNQKHQKGKDKEIYPNVGPLRVSIGAHGAFRKNSVRKKSITGNAPNRLMSSMAHIAFLNFSQHRIPVLAANPNSIGSCFKQSVLYTDLTFQFSEDWIKQFG